MSIKSTISTARWKRAQSKVNNAVSTFLKYGAGYSPTEGIIGAPKNLPKRESKKLSAAADTMRRYSAGYYTDKRSFKGTDAVQTGHYEPLSLSDYETVQEIAFRQARSSMHLRAPNKFMQRILYDPRLQAHPVRRVLGIAPEESQEWSALVESLWRNEKESKDWDESKQNNYSQLSDMSLHSYIEMGEFIAIRRAYFNDDNRITNLSIQLISPFQVTSPIMTGRYTIQTGFKADGPVLVNCAQYLSGMPDGNFIESGFEYNKKGEEVAIFVAPVTIRDPWIRIPIKTNSGFTQVLHGFIQKEPGQKRGIPESAYHWHEYCNIKDLTIFELNSARLNSSISGTVTADSNAQPNGKKPMNDLGDPGWPATPPGTTAETLAPYQPPNYDVRKVEGGGFIVQNFTPGYKYTEHDTKRPNVNIPLYIDKLLDYIYISQDGVSRSVVTQTFDGSYNASKGKIDISWKTGVEYHLKQFSSDWHRPNYEAWLNGKVASGEVAAPGWEDVKKRYAWTSMSIITPAKPSLNPLQEAKAGAERLKYLATNMELEAQQQTGTSAEENADRQRMEYGLVREISEIAEPPEPQGGQNDA